MKNIEAKILLKAVDKWDVNWNTPGEKEIQLKKLEVEMKMAIHDRCGVDYDKIKIELNLVEND